MYRPNQKITCSISHITNLGEDRNVTHANGEMCLKSDVFIHITCIDMLTKQGKRESTENTLELLNIEKIQCNI
jgi:hypothetical protein